MSPTPTWLVFLTLLGHTLGYYFPKGLPPGQDSKGILKTLLSERLQRQSFKSCDASYRFPTFKKSATLTSENYPDPYPNNLFINYCIESPPGTKMVLNCAEIDIENSLGCSYDYLGISLTGNFSNVEKLCGKRSYYYSPLTNSNRMNIQFKTDSSNPSSSIVNYRFKCEIVVSGSQQNYTTSTTTTTAIPKTSTKIPDSTCKCGSKIEAKRIVGGIPATLNKCYLRTDTYEFFCGCSIINENWILTAAHCTDAVKNIIKRGKENLYVVVGDHLRSQSKSPPAKTVRVVSYTQHPSYDDVSQDNDISLLKLDSPLTFTREISPICLPWGMELKNFQGANVSSSGWGKTSSNGEVSDVLREIELPVLTTEQCARYYPGGITNNMICTYKQGKDTCQGDSGGSIDYLDPNTGRFRVIGVVSWGYGCAERNKPGVYAKVTKYLNWIQSTTNAKFCKS